MRRRVVWIDCQRFLVRLTRTSEAFATAQQPETCFVDEIPRQPVPSRGIARINLERLSEKCIRLRKRLGSDLPPKLYRLKVKRVSLRISLANRRLRAQQCHFQLLNHIGSDLVLDLEDVVELPVVSLRPNLETVRGVDELGRDPHLVADLAYRSLKNVRDPQLPGDFRNADVLPLERERRRASHDLELVDLREQVQELLGDTIGEVFLVLV